MPSKFGDEYSNSPSPRHKPKNRKIKIWSRSSNSAGAAQPVGLTGTVPAVSSETASSSGGSVVSACAGGSSGGGSGNLANPSASSSAGAISSSGLHSGLLLPKMQAEQGSIGDLQKYHSRYLKNRRHTLANVR